MWIAAIEGSRYDLVTLDMRMKGMDGIETTRQIMQRLPAAYDPARVKQVYGGDPKFERPKVLCIAGRPAWLYAPSGWNVTGGQRTVNHVLKIALRSGDGPLSGLTSASSETERQPANPPL